MKRFRLEQELRLPRPIEEVFSFFGDPANLEAITPPWLRFKVLDCSEGPLRRGSKIDYRLRIRGIPIGWTSLISRWEPPFAFVDEQLRGPYRSWVHEHTFEEQDGETLVRDRVDYSILGGRIVNALFVRRDLERVFAHREQSLRALLG